MQEEWKKWIPTQGLSGQYDVETIIDGPTNFTLKLSSNNDRHQKVTIVFNAYVDSYRHTNESFHINTIHELTQKYGADFYGTWSFFTVEHSEYVQWLSHVSSTYSDMFSFIHFSIIGTDSIVDIITRWQPTVTISQEI